MQIAKCDKDPGNGPMTGQEKVKENKMKCIHINLNKKINNNKIQR